MMNDKDTSDSRRYFLATVAKNVDGESALRRVERLVGKEVIWAFGRKLAARRRVRKGDGICFYAATSGMVGVAEINSVPENLKHRAVAEYDRYPWLVNLKKVHLFSDRPIRLDEGIRKQLDAFAGRPSDEQWSWFVQYSHEVTSHDFQLLTTHGSL